MDKHCLKLVLNDKPDMGKRLFDIEISRLLDMGLKLQAAHFIDSTLIGTRKYIEENKIIVKDNTVKILKTPYKGNSLASCEELDFSSIMQRFLDLTMKYKGLQDLTVFKRSGGYRKTDFYNYFIGGTVNIMVENDCLPGEIIYFIVKLALGLSSKMLNKKELNEEVIRNSIQTVLGPWLSAYSLSFKGFYHTSSCVGMTIGGYILYDIVNYDLTGITNATELLPIRNYSYVERYKYKKIKGLPDDSKNLLIKIEDYSRKKGFSIYETLEYLSEMRRRYTDTQLIELYKSIKV
ncbi:hypothetical protein D3C81_06890 [compost metagenome]